MSLEKVKESIEKGINFLYQNQLPWGEFKTYACWNSRFLGAYFDSNPFCTALILDSIKEIPDERVEEMTKKGIEFLLSEKEKGGIWRFWSSRNKKKLPADLDDISVVSRILKINGVYFEDNTSLILKNKNKENLFLTWLIQKEDKENVTWWIDKIYKIFEVAKIDVDDVVNVNVLRYLGKEDERVCSFINQLIKSGQRRSFHYPKKIVFFYFVSKAFKEGIFCFKESQRKILEEVLKLKKERGSFGKDLETALALNILFNFGYFGKEIDLGINYLLKRQSKKGFWQKGVLFVGPFPYRYYGSEELTTAFCLEALQHYLKLWKK